MLAWGLIEFRDAYVTTGQLDFMLDSIKWPLDYFIKCHVSDTQFYGQVRVGHAAQHVVNCHTISRADLCPTRSSTERMRHYIRRNE